MILKCRKKELKFTFISLTLEMQERKELKMHFTEERKGYLSTFRFKINIKYIHILFFLRLKHVKQENVPLGGGMEGKKDGKKS